MVVKEGEFTKRQGAFFKNWARTGFDMKKKTDCARRAKYPFPAQSAYKILNSPRVNEAMQKVMIEEGYTPQEAIKELKRLSFDSMNPFRPKQPDNTERRKSIKMGLELFDAFPAQKVDIRKTEAYFELTVEDVKKLDNDLGRKTPIDAEVVEEEEVEPF